jgi:hypothetical protein
MLPLAHTTDAPMVLRAQALAARAELLSGGDNPAPEGHRRRVP